MTRITTRYLLTLVSAIAVIGVAGFFMARQLGDPTESAN